jgi:hypothetical protein
VKYGLTFAKRKILESRTWLLTKSNIAFLATRNYLLRRGVELKPFAFSVLSTFSAEAAVLILVFPPLESFLGRNTQSANGVRPLDVVPVMKWSVILCLGLLALSIWFKEIAHRADANLREED